VPKIIPITVYQFDELDDQARDAARSWYRQSALDYDWYDFVFSDFESICETLGIDLRIRPISLTGGDARHEPQIYFSGFSSQGDGACFAGRYSYRKGASRAIRAHAPRDTELHRIADTLRDTQRRHFYQLSVHIRHRGRYYHEYCMEISVERDRLDFSDVAADATEAIIETLRDLARWLYRRLEAEYEHQTSDETVDEGIRVNEYLFTACGDRFANA
jgi:hypothetical protein